jgi:hypothetical protein
VHQLLEPSGTEKYPAQQLAGQVRGCCRENMAMLWRWS